MGNYIRLPEPLEAVQFTGDNWAEMLGFCGVRMIEKRATPIFTKVGTYLLDYLEPGASAELWEEFDKRLVYVFKGDWIVKDGHGCYVVKDNLFRQKYRSMDGMIADAEEIEKLLDPLEGEKNGAFLAVQVLMNAGYRLVKEA
jgi:hypothetical protein